METICIDKLDHQDHPGNPDHLDHIDNLDFLYHLDEFCVDVLADVLEG